MKPKPHAPGDFRSVGDVLDALSGPLFDAAPDASEKPSQTSRQPRKTNDKLARAAEAISAAPDQSEAAYLARELVQCTLPHKDPGQVNGWKRSNGNFHLVLQGALDPETLQPLGLPYGSIPRLILLWIVTEAIRTKSRHIKLGETLNDFLREIGLDPKTGGGKRSDATRVKDQLVRLLRCRISFEYKDSNRQSWREMPVAAEGDFWWDNQKPDQNPIFENNIVLGEKFFQAISTAPVPIDMRALIPLKQSPLAIDVYTWATYRIFTMQRAGDRQIRISLAQLKQQFGSEYTRPRDFKAAFVEALEKVQQVFPALDYSFNRDIFVLHNNHKRPAIAPTDKTAAQRHLAEQDHFNVVSDKARARFKAEFPDWDVEAVISDFYLWRQDKGEVSANTDAHFRAFPSLCQNMGAAQPLTQTRSSRPAFGRAKSRTLF